MGHIKAESVASRVEREIAQDAHYRKAIDLGIANYSAIAKQIAARTGCGEEAVKVAVSRCADRQKAGFDATEKRAKGVLKNSTIALQDDIAVAVLENSRTARRFLADLESIDAKYAVFSPRSITLVCRSADLPRIEKSLVLKKSQGLCMLQLSSPEDIEKVPGVLSFLLDSLSRRNINVLETYSCYTETSLIVSREDAVGSFEAVEEACGKA